MTPVDATKTDSSEIPTYKRSTTGVRVMKLNEDQIVAHMTLVAKEEEEENVEEAIEGAEPTEVAEAAESPAEATEETKE